MKLDRSYTEEHEVQTDGSVTFACSGDCDEWPWLALPPQHPLVIQTQNFWTSVGATQALVERDDGKWSALTWTDWTLGDHGAVRAVRGHFSRTGNSDELGFKTELFDHADRLIVKIGGKGVVFRTRNFEKWREGSKTTAKEQAITPTDFEYAKRELLGLSEQEPPLIAPLTETNGMMATTALITKANGLMPGHPYFSGSGDHVNAPHLAELGRQTVSLLCEGARVQIVQGEMDMHRYIELGTPIAIVAEQAGDNEVTLSVSQLDRSCAKITMKWVSA
ncbi:MAG: hypothetical protein AAGL68_07875 [Pseudomonadota bacterium]